jgi:hypothetical protein
MSSTPTPGRPGLEAQDRPPGAGPHGDTLSNRCLIAVVRPPRVVDVKEHTTDH